MFFFFLPHLAPPEQISALRTAFAAARDVLPDATTSTVTTFLDVAVQTSAEPRSAAQLADAAGISYPRFMRHIDVLGDGTRRAPGHGLLTKVFSPQRRRQEIQLTPKGMQLLMSMAAAISRPEGVETNVP